jgi:hypothetical protein
VIKQSYSCADNRKRIKHHVGLGGRMESAAFGGRLAFTQLAPRTRAFDRPAFDAAMDAHCKPVVA